MVGRVPVRAWVTVWGVVSLIAAGCGSDDEPGSGSEGLVAVPAQEPSDASPRIAGESVAAFGFDVLAATAARAPAGSNVVISPLSIAFALGMVEPGASGDSVAQFGDLLRIDDPAVWRDSMSSLTQSLESRQPDPVAELAGTEQDPGELVINLADAAFVQPGYAFVPDYLDLIGTKFGAVIEEVDFTDAGGAAERINAFVAGETDNLIPELVKPEAIDPATVLALVNALLLKASWQTTFDAASTATAPFTRLDGSTVDVPLMRGGGDRSGAGDGWVGASKALVGGLRFEVVLPDEGRFDEIAARYADVTAELAAAPNPGGELAVPNFETRVSVALADVLKSLGLTAPFAEGGLMGIADDPKLLIDDVLHETFLSIDEDGIEAAAATIVLIVATGAPIDQPVPVVLDRPFLFRIVDDESGTPLFAGRIMDPTA
jgi:serpin B